MAGTKTCGKCGGRMAEGFTPEYTHHSSTKIEEWFEGAPERGWFGLKLRGKRRMAVETYRCERCGYLESYAPAA
jgi:predicted nucleic-acid-binding Zn-ribbon protein